MVPPRSLPRGRPTGSSGADASRTEEEEEEAVRRAAAAAAAEDEEEEEPAVLRGTLRTVVVCLVRIWMALWTKTLSRRVWIERATDSLRKRICWRAFSRSPSWATGLPERSTLKSWMLALQTLTMQSKAVSSTRLCERSTLCSFLVDFAKLSSKSLPTDVPASPLQERSTVCRLASRERQRTSSSNEETQSGERRDFERESSSRA